MLKIWNNKPPTAEDVSEKRAAAQAELDALAHKRAELLQADIENYGTGAASNSAELALLDGRRAVLEGVLAALDKAGAQAELRAIAARHKARRQRLQAIAKRLAITGPRIDALKAELQDLYAEETSLRREGWPLQDAGTWVALELDNAELSRTEYGPQLQAMLDEINHAIPVPAIAVNSADAEFYRAREKEQG